MLSLLKVDFIPTNQINDNNPHRFQTAQMGPGLSKNCYKSNRVQRWSSKDVEIWRRSETQGGCVRVYAYVYIYIYWRILNSIICVYMYIYICVCVC